MRAMRQRMRIAIRFLIFFSMAGVSLNAQAPAETWSAEWIAATDAPQRDASVVRFRKVLDLPQVPEHFVVRVSADNQFILYVNQKRVGLGPARSDLAHWRYETYDLAPFLHTGKNILAATVWNFGILTPLAQISDRTAFLLHGASAAERAA